MNNDTRLIEQGFPCHQVGAETQRERDTGKAPPTHRLHVWWARRPLTPSRAAILASLLPADTDPEMFVRSLGIEKKVALVNGVEWTLPDKLLDRIQPDGQGGECLPVDAVVLRALEKEQERRSYNQRIIEKITHADFQLAKHPILKDWSKESSLLEIQDLNPTLNLRLDVITVMGDPAKINTRIEFAKDPRIKKILGKAIHWDPEDLYAYPRAFSASKDYIGQNITVLDPTSGGGSIPFEALRLGYNVIANDLNPVASTILQSTLKFPAQFGISLVDDIERWGEILVSDVNNKMKSCYHFEPISHEELEILNDNCSKCPEIIAQFSGPENDHTAQIYCRQVTCPHCGGEAPLLNSCWLSKQAGDQWGVKVVPDGQLKNGKVSFVPYKVTNGKGPQGEDPDFSTVTRGVGQCIHCKQAIAGDEIKAQARGESRFGKWEDRLYCVVAIRFEPVLDKNGQPSRYKSGPKKGEIRTKKIRFFRAPNAKDLQALKEAEAMLQQRWDEWDGQGYIPTEKFPEGNDMRPVTYGMPRWCDMFTPRQLLGHITLIKGLNKLKPQILAELGEEKGRAVVTYLQFAIDKGVDYNSRQTRWEYTRGIVKGNFGRHDFSLKWTFGEMIFSGPNSGAAWGLSQIIDSYKGIAELVDPIHKHFLDGNKLPLSIRNGSATNMPDIASNSVDLVCMDPPYYNNVQYAELSDLFYVFQKRTLKDLYPGVFNRRLTNKKEEAVANPVRDGSTKNAKIAYEKFMSEIFSECHRVIKPEGLMTLMFTHKSQDAWETLIRSLIDSGWIISASVPVESESAASMHQKDMAAAASSIFITCRKKQDTKLPEPFLWKGLGGKGVQAEIRDAVKVALEEFGHLQLNPVDEMVSCYGRALKVLSEKWPVMDGDEPVSPILAMTEASRVVAENNIRKVTRGRIQVEELDSETAISLILFGIWSLGEFSFDEALNISKSLNISLQQKSGGYTVSDQSVGIAQATNRRGAASQSEGFHAPLVRSGSKLRLAAPEERNAKRLDHPQTDWDILHGCIQQYKKGGIPLARPYLEEHAGESRTRIIDLLQVWTTEQDDPERKKLGEQILFDLQ
jgi:adenine-specific DNA methylase